MKGENKIWWVSTSRWRFLWRERDAFYLACGRLRVRVIKPWVRRRGDFVP